MERYPASTSELDEQTRSMIDKIEANPFLDPENMTPDEMRAAFDRFYIDLGYPSLPIASVEDVEVEGPGGALKTRVYYPLDSHSRQLPLVVFFHGGGMMMGSVAAYDGFCRRLAHQSGCIIASSSYRLAPENKFPDAVNDASTVVRWFHKNAHRFGGDPNQIAIAGESGGGNLATVTAGRLGPVGGGLVKYQVLINPAVGTDFNTPSMEMFAKGYFFEPDALRWFYSLYLPDMALMSNPEVSPIFDQDLSKMPPAFFVAAGCDILRSDIEDYAAKMKAAGVAVDMSIYEHTIHGFTCMAGQIDKGRAALDECAAKLRQFFNL